MVVPVPAPLVTRFRADVLALTGREPAADARLGIAVSGGADSLALLLLAHAAFPGAVAAATVDHRMRAESAAEAAFVAEVCAVLGIPHATLADDSANRGRGQRWARALRYRLLAGWMPRADVRWIATAHHHDDQAETFLMRAARGAGLGGLASIRRSAVMPHAVVRPVIGWSREELRAIVDAAGIAAVDDPSNADDRYDRTAFRRLLADHPWLLAERLAQSASNLADAEEAMLWVTQRLWTERATIEDHEVVSLDVSGLPRELRRRLLKQAVDHLHGKAAPARPYRLDRLDGLLTRLDQGCAGTIASLKASPGERWRIEPAPPRKSG